MRTGNTPRTDSMAGKDKSGVKVPTSVWLDFKARCKRMSLRVGYQITMERLLMARLKFGELWPDEADLALLRVFADPESEARHKDELRGLAQAMADGLRRSEKASRL